MADTKISALSDGSAIVGGDQLVIARSGQNYKIDGKTVTGADGWVDDSSETWTYASGSGGGAASFTIAGVDLTAKYTPGTRIKLTQTTVKYFVVTLSTFSTNTTVNIMAGTDYTLANAAISTNYHSYMANPQGYPGLFQYTPTVTGITGPAHSSQFTVVGRLCTFWFGLTGTSNTTGKTCTLPVKFGQLFQNANPMRQAFSCRDNGAVQNAPGRSDLYVGNDPTIFTLYRLFDGTLWTASGTWYAYGVLVYPI